MHDTEFNGVMADVSSWNWLHWTGLLLSVCVAAINIYIGYTESQSPFFVIGASFLLGVVLFMTRFWNPILYLLGVLHIVALGIIWFLDGMRFLAFGIATGILSTGLTVIALYLFFEEAKANAR
ncbi:hypothetical protein [Natronococcus sp. A-GB7]|uniref:hypothetical protein n=1 Tax=Natronococcus sp. A-GB7 TaxID=3037649 RepID=UPI00241DF11C|nr:hypothetical protein [Natronococcus sp. A-GB7]MDG5819766.1 hypothetical protein [Natronococcus sp. A-GB7]